MSIRVEVRYFAAAREAVGREAETVRLEAGEASVDGLRDLLGRRHPPLRRLLAASRFAVGERFAPPAAPLEEGSVVAVIPPVSGG